MSGTGTKSGHGMSSRLAAWLLPFSDCFTIPTWRHVLVLIAGAILSPGRRTVAAALRVVGLEQGASFTNYHRVLNRNSWSSRRIAGRLTRSPTYATRSLLASRRTCSSEGSCASGAGQGPRTWRKRASGMRCRPGIRDGNPSPPL